MNDSSSEARDTRCRILIVEDDGDTAFALECILEQDFEVLVISEGGSVLNACLEFSPDVVLMDINLPALDGISACRQLRFTPDFCNLPVLFLTSSDEPTILIEAFSAGGVDFIRKPFERSEVVARVTTQAQLHKATVERQHRLGYLSDALAGLEQSYLFFANQTADILMRCSPEGIVRHVNRKWADTVGSEVSSPIGRPLWDITVPEDRDVVRANFQGALSDGTESLFLEFSVPMRTGEIPMRASLLFRRRDSGPCVECNVVLTNISEYLAGGNTRRDAVSPRLETLAANLLHNVRTPLNAIQGALTILKAIDHHPQVTEATSLLEKGVAHMDRTLANVCMEDSFTSGNIRAENHPRVLLVDDLPMNLRVLQFAIRGMGFTQIDLATSGEQALALWKTHCHNLVLLDYQMGEMSGYSLCRAIRSEPKGALVSIVGISANVRPENAHLAVEAGIDAEVAKPVSRIKLNRVFESLNIKPR